MVFFTDNPIAQGLNGLVLYAKIIIAHAWYDKGVPLPFEDGEYGTPPDKEKIVKK